MDFGLIACLLLTPFPASLARPEAVTPTARPLQPRDGTGRKVSQSCHQPIPSIQFLVCCLCIADNHTHNTLITSVYFHPLPSVYSVSLARRRDLEKGKKQKHFLGHQKACREREGNREKESIGCRGYYCSSCPVS